MFSSNIRILMKDKTNTVARNKLWKGGGKGPRMPTDVGNQIEHFSTLLLSVKNKFKKIRTSIYFYLFIYFWRGGYNFILLNVFDFNKLKIIFLLYS